MKLLIIILSDRDCEEVMDSLVKQEFRVTRVASTGGFLRRGNSTLLSGVSDDQVDRALSVIRQTACEPLESTQRRATVFVLNVDHHEQF